MDQKTWDNMTPAQREAARDLSDLSPQLIGLEGWRVEVEEMDGQRHRFIVGMSTGWRPIHLALARRTSSGGFAADREFKSVRAIEKVR